MMRPLSRTVLFSLLSAGVLPISPLSPLQAADTQSVESGSIEDRALARRRMAVRDAMLQVQEARNAYSAGRYTEAEEHYRNALAVLPKAPATKKQEEFIRQSLADALVAKAMDYRKVGRYEEAVNFLNEAIKLDPANNRAKKELALTNDPVRNNPALTPKHGADVAEVQRLLELGQGYYGLGKFDEAYAAYNAVLKIDPYNSAARKGMEAVSARRSSYINEAARPAMRAKMMADVDAIWEEAVPEEKLPEFGAVADAESSVDEDVKRDYAERLEAMVMPSISFDGASISEVVAALQNQILRFEASGEGGKSGRHINLTQNFGSKDSPAYKNLMEQEVSLTLSEVSIKDILDLLSKRLDIQYFYTDLGVELCLGGRDSGPLMDRVFVVPPHFFDPDRGDDEESDDEDDGFSASSVKVKRVNPKQTLMSMGITFPEGSTLAYSPSTRLLRVRNTQQNLDDIESAMDIPMDKDTQVVLSVIALEVSQDDLDQLGFDWLFNLSAGHGKFLSGAASETATKATGAPIFTAELGSETSPAMTSGLRDARALVTNNSIDSLIENGSVASYNRSSAHSPSIFGVRGVWNVADVTFVMRGLSQKKGVDVLQNPKIIFSPGNEEQIAFGSVQEMYFPEEWEKGEVALTNNATEHFTFSSISTPPHPVNFVRMGCVDDEVDGIGTTLVVHSAELEETEQGTFINLALTTTVKEFEGFVNWGTPINTGMISPNGEIKFVQISPNYILQPMIKRRLENTQIRLAPGAVLVIGGLKEARSVEFEDKIPVIGDLPLVGRLFRSSGESKMRKALIFFVKVDLVDPTGRNIQTGARPSTEQ